MSNTNKYIIFGSPLIEKEEVDEVVATLKSGWLGTGPRVAKFEQLVKEYVGTRYGLALNSCTAGLHLSLLASGVKEGDEVITTPLTFCATANAIVHTRAKPVFVDVDKDTMNMDDKLLEKEITAKTKAIIPVHFAGRPCRMEHINKIAKKYKLLVIEDAAHALGAEYKGKKIGSLSDATCFSFYVTKNITTGEGGIITTNNQKLADKIKIYALHGMSKDAWQRYSDNGYRHYDIVYPGYKYNMMDLQAAIGIRQMGRIEKYYNRRNKIWNFYNENFKNLPITLPAEFEPDTKHALHLYTILVDKKQTGFSRDEFAGKLHNLGIGSGVHYRPVHLSSYYKKRFSYKKGDYPNAEYIGERTVSLPLGAKLTDGEIEKVVGSVKKILNRKPANQL